MSKIRKYHPAHLKAKAVLELLRETSPLSELCSRFGIHARVLNRWRREALYHTEEGCQEGFKGKNEKTQKDHASEAKTLHAIPNELQNDFLVDASKKLSLGGGKK